MFDFNHLRDNGSSYRQHGRFAMFVALRMLAASLLLMVHSVLPFVMMPKGLSIKGMSDFLFDKHSESYERAERSKKRVRNSNEL